MYMIRKYLLTMIIVLGAILFLCGCQDLRWNWSDNRKRIKPKLLDDEYRQSQDYKDMVDIVIWHEYVRRYGDVYQKKSEGE